MTHIRTVEQLEKIVGSTPLAVMMKSLDALDPHCERLLRHSPFAILGFCERGGRARAVTIGGAPGFATVLDRSRLRIPSQESWEIDERVGCALIFFIPGHGETLRINGRLVASGEALDILVEEAFLHCAKAVLRSSLWHGALPASERPMLDATSGPLAPAGVREFLSSTPFVVVTSWNARGEADASPKGDPPGFLALCGDRLVVAERPGNRRTDTFRNLLTQPRVAMVALRPGDDRVVELSARASLSADPELLATLSVHERTPKLAMLLDVEAARLSPSAAIRDAKLWEPARHPPTSELPRGVDVLRDHIQQSKRRGLEAALVRRLSSRPLVAWVLRRDYEKNRY